jgi:hypothetical protein
VIIDFIARKSSRWAAFPRGAGGFSPVARQTQHFDCLPQMNDPAHHFMSIIIVVVNDHAAATG